MAQFKVAFLVTFAFHLLFVSIADYCDENLPISKTKYGDIRGTVMKSRKGKLFAAFRGIPYAEPPVDDLRFKAPKEISKWKGIKNATRDSPICIQQNYLFHAQPLIEGSEDCLYISVYSSKALCHAKKSNRLLPVMIFIPYGGFLGEDAGSDLIGPEYIMDEDVIFVTFNYRVGVMGFFSTFDDEAPGNWGFKDQVAALEWVKQNIHYFGGSNKKITVVGQSAGAGSVHHLMLSPSSQGLFQAAISMSGIATAPWAKPLGDLQILIANFTGKAVGCDNGTTKDLVKCLRNVSANVLVNGVNKFRHIYSEPLTPYFPALESKTERNPEPFITEDPVDIIKRGNFQKVPWIVGVVADEGIIRAAPFTRREEIVTQINTDFDNNFIKMMGFQLSAPESSINTLWSQIKDYYFGAKNEIDPSNHEFINGLIDLYSDRAFFYPTYQALHLHKGVDHEHIFMYNFNYRGKYTYGDLFAGTSHDVDYKWGVSHCDDLLYLFYSPGFFADYHLSKSDMKMSEIMLHFFLNFVKHRDPTPKSIWGNKQRWEELPITDKDLSDDDLYYLDISGSYEDNIYHLNMTNGFYVERMKFWKSRSIFENLNFVNSTSLAVN